MDHEQRTVSLKRLNSFYFSMGFYFQWDYKQDPRETLQTHRTPRWSIGLLLPTYQGHVCFASLSIAASCFVVVVVELGGKWKEHVNSIPSTVSPLHMSEFRLERAFMSPI